MEVCAVMTGYWDNNASWVAMGLGLLVWLVVAIVVVWLVVRGLSALDRGRSADADTPSRATPDDILRERFARGEIDADELEKRLKVLHP
jgi:putative membrane protein